MDIQTVAIIISSKSEFPLTLMHFSVNYFASVKM